MPINAPYHSSMEKEVAKAANILNAFFDSTLDADSSIPVELIQGCRGLAFLTVVKAGLIWTGKVGTGIVIARLEDGSWSPPSGIGTAGMGFGAEIGGEIIDFMIVLGSDSAVRTFKKGTQVSVGAGLDLAMGPVGRTAGANVNAGGAGFSANYTYSHAKGLFAGVGLHGSTILVRGDMNSKFYGRDVSPLEILSGNVQPPTGSCDVLFNAIQRVSTNNAELLAPARNSASGSMDHTSSNYGSNARQAGYASSNSRSSLTSSDRGSTGSSDRPRSTSSTSSAMSGTPIPDDPRLRRYGQYKSERELYAQFSNKQQQNSGSTTSAPVYSAAPAYGAQSYGAAVPVSAPAYSAAPAYGTQSYGAPAPAPAAAPAPHYNPATPGLTYTSYPAPTAPYVPPPQSQTNYPHAPAPAPVSYQQVPPIPKATSGAETKEVYTQVINFVSARCPYANVQVFKDNCRLFGQDALSLDAYFSYLSSICTPALLKELVPQLVRLLPTHEKRERLWVRLSKFYVCCDACS